VQTHRLTLILAGLFSTGVIAAGAAMAGRYPAPWPLLAGLLAATYGLGLGAGRLLFGRGR
jgi:alkanesulfonate monooxygenase SsuD/methylene tetrahydromethanopterin reductase-like flavin-dependent oxidoreductase (luciferase family)